ncbi:MAG: zf-HC2 domain-containing protein [Pseudomonas sp.]|jgi:anti-sigma factor RsiW|uniref:anti-sigma factor family protein n=1 Tax=Halopseudomonas TaxID=2901189 RepID=UPI001B781EC9|nr:zf-HC2 domain-containing protein [Pseudomonas sp.]MBQ0777556.1 zf-HC2 domain-containing protein [Pseudomonas sp.]WOD09539.1 zf-HC2 domain-containing protein [Pseudomonas sp. NyZ704]
MLSCKDLVMHSSDLLDGQLSFRRQLAVRAHLAICWKCRRFVRQLRMAQQVIRALPEDPIPNVDALAQNLAERQRGDR